MQAYAYIHTYKQTCIHTHTYIHTYILSCRGVITNMLDWVSGFEPQLCLKVYFWINNLGKSMNSFIPESNWLKGITTVQLQVWLWLLIIHIGWYTNKHIYIYMCVCVCVCAKFSLRRDHKYEAFADNLILHTLGNAFIWTLTALCGQNRSQVQLNIWCRAGSKTSLVQVKNFLQILSAFSFRCVYPTWVKNIYPVTIYTF